MLPYIEIFGVSIPAYGLISIMGTITAGIVSFAAAKKRKVDMHNLICTAIAAAVGVFAGAHILYSLTRIEDVVYILGNYHHYGSFWDFARELFACMNGMVFYGGLYGGLLVGFIFAKIKKYPLEDMSDVFSVFVPLFHTFGRVGCFFAGCCYGVKSEFGIAGRVYATGMRENAKRLPIQLIEAVCVLALFLVMLMLFKKVKVRGRLIFVYLMIYAVLRFALEFLRGDEIRGHFLMFSTSQWISILTLIWVGVYFLTHHLRTRK